MNVAKEIKNLKQNDITEDVTNKPTPWVNTLIVVNKDDKKIRLCLDKQNVNDTIEQTQFSLPTIGNFLVNLSKATYFLKYNLNSTFSQLKLHTKILFKLQDFVQKLRL